MTIGPGTPWSAPGLLPENAPVFDGDQALSTALAAARAAEATPPVIGLTGGTLWTTLGGLSVPGRLHTAEARRYPVDLGVVVADGVTHLFVGSVVARQRCWRDAVAVMNTPFLGRLRMAPRAHPGDALLDIIEAQSLSLDDIRRIVPRLRHGTHLPHPKLRERRMASASWTFDRPRALLVDGRRMGRVTEMSVRLEPDAVTVVV